MSAERARLLTSLSALYGVRWALVGVINTRRWESISSSVITSIVHALLHQLLPAMIALTGNHAARPLTALDKGAAVLAVAAAVLQQGSELQRYAFRRDPANRGKLFQGGLFSSAQFINHTGHVLGDLANALLVLPYHLTWHGDLRALPSYQSSDKLTNLNAGALGFLPRLSNVDHSARSHHERGTGHDQAPQSQVWVAV